MSSQRHPGICRAQSIYHSPNWLAELPTWRDANSQLLWSASLIGARRGPPQTCWLQVLQTSRYFAVAQTAGISEGWRWTDTDASALCDCIDLVALYINRAHA
jgi:hypothetical protein